MAWAVTLLDTINGKQELLVACFTFEFLNTAFIVILIVIIFFPGL